MFKKTQMNTTKFNSTNYLSQGFIGDLFPRAYLTGNINQENNLLEKEEWARSGPDLAGMGRAVRRAAQPAAHLHERSGTGLPLLPRHAEQSKRGKARNGARLASAIPAIPDRKSVV